MAGTITLSVSPLANATTKLFHSSPIDHPLAHYSFLLHHHAHLTRHNINICHLSRPNKSNNEERCEVDEAFPFDGDDLVEDDETDDEEDETESSIDLLVRFLQSIYRNISKRAKKASRSVLPAAISTQLVSFAVDGVLLLASLSIIKALLEVVCTFGGTVFVVILLLRVIWASISYFQSNRSNFNHAGSSFGTTQPVT